MNTVEIKEYLKEHADSDYQAFTQKLVPNVANVLGIRMPELRKLAKMIIKEDIRSYLEEYPCEFYEDYMLRGLVIAGANMPIEEKINYLRAFVPTIDNWAVCDSMISSLKLKKNELVPVYDFLMEYKNSKNEYELRFLFVTLMYYYLEDIYLDSIIEIINDTEVDYYYTNMAIAWLLSYMYLYNPSYAINYLKNNPLNKFTHNKAIQKIIESKRTNEEEKEKLKLLKRK